MFYSVEAGAQCTFMARETKALEVFWKPVAAQLTGSVASLFTISSCQGLDPPTLANVTTAVNLISLPDGHHNRAQCSWHM